MISIEKGKKEFDFSRNGTFFGPKMHLFIRFSEILCSDRHSKESKSDCFSFLLDNFEYTQRTSQAQN